jgi:hypothetical protein
MTLFSSCADDIVKKDVVPPDESDEMVPVFLNLKDLFGSESPGTYGLTDVGPETGYGPENTITDVTVFVFNANTKVCEKIMVGSSPYDRVGPELVKAGPKIFIAVANSAGKLPTSSIFTPGNESLVSYNVFRKTLTNTITSLPAAPFLMTGETTQTLTPLETETSPNQVTIEMKRAVAKVKVFISKSARAISHNITMQSITLRKGANRVSLMENDPLETGVGYSLSEQKGTFDALSLGVVPLDGSGYCMLADTFYTYETLCGKDTTKAVYLELAAAVNSLTNVRKARVYLAEDIKTPLDTVYDVYRNYWYNVYINIVDPGMDSVYVTVKSSPWNVADTIKEIVGEGAEVRTANPFRLVKSYTASELGSLSGPNIQFAAIDAHTKGASWVDLKVTNGTIWKLKLKDGSERNRGVIASVDGGNTWVDITTSSPLTGTGNDLYQRVYIYRPYRENDEPKQGPALYLTLTSADIYKQDLVIQPRDTTPIPANCYILRPQLTGAPVNETRAYIPLAGVYRYWEDHLLDNGAAIPDGEVSAELLWDDSQTGNVVKNISVTNKNKRDSAYIYAEAGIPGNAVIAMKVGGNIYWSFHIWVTEYNPYEAAGQKLYKSPSSIKNVFMDRDLGAMNNTYDADGKVRGLFYQFGRKDPFPSGVPGSWSNVFAWYNSSGAQLSLSSLATQVPSGSSSLRPLTAIPASINNPTTFYTRGGATDWSLSVENEFLWSTQGGNKTAFDPCPEGWRVPEQPSYGSQSSPWYNVTFSSTAYTNGHYSATVGYYPYSGYIGTSTSVITDVATSAYSWTSWAGASSRNYLDGTGLLISTTSTSTDPYIDKAYGVSVRCVVDLNYLLSKEGGGLFGSGAGTLEGELLP